MKIAYFKDKKYAVPIRVRTLLSSAYYNFLCFNYITPV
jgi:hypothetical protein